MFYRLQACARGGVPRFGFVQWNPEIDGEAQLVVCAAGYSLVSNV